MRFACADRSFEHGRHCTLRNFVGGAALTREAKLKTLADHCKAAKSKFDAEYGAAVAGYREAITAAVQTFVSDLRQNVANVAGNNVVCDTVVERAGQYLDWLQWTFWDLPYYACAVRLPIERLKKGVR